MSGPGYLAHTVFARLRRFPPILVLIAALVLATVLWAVLQHAELYLGHDESVYANKARSWVTGDPDAGWQVYRPLGLPVAGFLALQISDSTGALRVTALLFDLATIAAVFWVASRVTTVRRAAVTVIVMISGATFLRRMPEFLDDIPSSGLLLVTAYLVLRSRRPEGSWALPLASVTAVLALVLRFGAMAGLVSIALAAVLVWGPRVWIRAGPELAVAAALGFALLAPLLLYSHRVSGSWIGIFTRAAGTPGEGWFGEGLVYYARTFPLLLAGPVGALVMLAGLAHVLLRRAGPELTFLALAGLIQVLILGLLTHGETRYIYFTVLALTIVGVQAIAVRAGSWRAVALTVTAVLALGSMAVTTVAVHHALTRISRDLAPTARVSAQLGQARANLPPSQRAPCLIVTDLQVLAAWQSRCDARQPGDPRALPQREVLHVLDWGSGTRLRAELARAPERGWSIVPVTAGGRSGYLATAEP